MDDKYCWYACLCSILCCFILNLVDCCCKFDLYMLFTVMDNNLVGAVGGFILQLVRI